MARDHVIRCQGCGAPLKPPPGASVVQCQYCEATNALGGPTLRGPAQYPPAVRRGRAGTWIALALTTAAVVAGVVSVLFKRDALFTEWYSIACPVDANGDGVIDLAGEGASPGSNTWQLMLVDGKSGKVLWRSSSRYSPQDNLLCLGRNAFGLAFPDARITVFDPHCRKPRWSAVLSDKVYKYGVKGDCLKLETSDQRQASLGLLDGKARRCDATTHMTSNAPGYFSSGLAAGSRMQIDAGSVTYRLQAQKEGTPLLTVSAHQGDRRLWQTRLRYASVESDMYFARAPNMLLTYGVNPARDEIGVLIAIDARTGRPRYAAAQGSHWSTQFARSFLFNGRYLVTTWGYGLHAYDPTTGKRVWQIGGR